MVYAQPRIIPGGWDTQTSLEFWYTNGSLSLVQTTKPSDSQQKLAEMWILLSQQTTL